MLISKKDLLAETGISYGQLYRWKRERLIPEEWFMKQSSFTGQETFFPKEQMLNRIRAIQDLKDKYSLEELAKLLSPEVSEGGFTIADLESLEEISKDLICTFQEILGTDNISYMEVLLLVILSDLRDELNLTNLQIGDMLEGMKVYLEEMKSTGYIIAVFNKDSEYYTVIYQEQTQIFFDVRFHIVKKVRIDDISNQLKIKYRQNFDFQFGEPKQSGDGAQPQQSQSDRFDKEEKQNQNNEESTKQKQQEEKIRQDKEQGSKKKDHKGEDLILKFNNWEVRL